MYGNPLFSVHLMSVDYIARRAAQRHTRTFSRSAVVDRLWPVPGTALHSSEAGYGPCRSSAGCYRAPRRSAASLWPAMVLSALCGLQRRSLPGWGNHWGGVLAIRQCVRHVTLARVNVRASDFGGWGASSARATL